MFLKHRAVCISITIVVLIVGSMGGGYAMAKASLNPIDENGVISAAYQKVNGMLRLVNGEQDVQPSEEFIQWNQVGIQGPPGEDGEDGEPGPQGPQGPQGPSQIGTWKFKSYSTKRVGGSFQTPTLFSLTSTAGVAVLKVDMILTMYSGAYERIASITYFISKPMGSSPSVVNTQTVYDWGDTAESWWIIDGLQISGNNISYKVTAKGSGQMSYVDMKFTYCVRNK